MHEVRDLHVGYGPFEVLHGASLDVAAGEIVAVLDANGVGKTILNRALSGVIAARRGTISFDGTDITRHGYDMIVRSGLIHVPEVRKIFSNLSVHDNLLLGAWLRGRSEQARTLDEVLELFPRLRERLRQVAGSMSAASSKCWRSGTA